MSRSLLVSLAPLSLLFLAAPLSWLGCGDKDDGDDTGGTADTDTDTDTDGGVEPVSYQVSFAEFLSGEPLADAPFVVDGETMASDAAGTLYLSGTPGDAIEISLALDGFPDIMSYRTFPDFDAGAALDVPSLSTLDLLGSALGMEVDPTKTQLSIGVFDVDSASGEVDHLAGATIDIDVPYEAVLVLDASSTIGLSGGNTTLEGSQATVIFVNADTGTITPTFTTPDGQVCADGTPSFSASPGSFTASLYRCE